MKFLLAGGSGFIGKALQAHLSIQGHSFHVLTTQPQLAAKYPNYYYWNPASLYIDPACQLESVTIINLSGVGVADKRWTKSRKHEIIQSRVQSLQTLFQAVSRGQIGCKHLISASAIGFYGNRTQICYEDTPGDTSFLSTTCQQWEQSAATFSTLSIPVSIIRVGIVLGKEGGAFPALYKPLQWGIAAIPGSGRQMYSWIHIHDIVNLFYTTACKPWVGILNGVAPHPCSMKTIIDNMAVYKKPLFSTYAPNWLLQWLMGEMSIEVLKSTHVSADKITNLGFEFAFPTINAAIQNLCTFNPNTPS